MFTKGTEYTFPSSKAVVLCDEVSPPVVISKTGQCRGTAAAQWMGRQRATSPLLSRHIATPTTQRAPGSKIRQAESVPTDPSLHKAVAQAFGQSNDVFVRIEDRACRSAEPSKARRVLEAFGVQI